MKPIQESLMDSLSEFSRNATAQGKVGFQYNKYWKEQIVYLFANEGKKRLFQVYNHPNAEEWGPDQCWTEMQDGQMRNIPLVMMCEWRPAPHLYERFCTVMAARTSLRVIICDATFPEDEAGGARYWAEQVTAGLKAYALNFNLTEPTDSYLFCVWCRDKGNEGKGEWYFDMVESLAE